MPALTHDNVTPISDETIYLAALSYANDPAAFGLKSSDLKYLLTALIADNEQRTLMHTLGIQNRKKRITLELLDLILNQLLDHLAFLWKKNQFSENQISKSWHPLWIALKHILTTDQIMADMGMITKPTTSPDTPAKQSELLIDYLTYQITNRMDPCDNGQIPSISSNSEKNTPIKTALTTLFEATPTENPSENHELDEMDAQLASHNEQTEPTKPLLDLLSFQEQSAELQKAIHLKLVVNHLLTHLKNHSHTTTPSTQAPLNIFGIDMDAFSNQPKSASVYLHNLESTLQRFSNSLDEMITQSDIKPNADLLNQILAKLHTLAFVIAYRKERHLEDTDANKKPVVLSPEEEKLKEHILECHFKKAQHHSLDKLTRLEQKNRENISACYKQHQDDQKQLRQQSYENNDLKRKLTQTEKSLHTTTKELFEQQEENQRKIQRIQIVRALENKFRKDLKNTYALLKKDHALLTEQVSNQKNTIQTSASDLASAQSQLGEAHKTVEALEEELAQTHMTLSGMKQSLVDSKVLMNRVEDNLDKSNELNTRQSKRIAALEDELRLKTNALTQAERKLTQTEKILHTITKKLFEQQEENQRDIQRIQVPRALEDKFHEDLKNTYAQLQKDHALLTEQVSNQKNTIETSASDLAKAQSQLGEAHEAVGTLKEELQETQITLSEMKQSLVASKALMSRVDKILDKSNELNIRQSERIAALEDELSLQTDTLTQAVRDANTVSAELTQIKQSYAHLRLQHQHLVGDMGDSQSENRELLQTLFHMDSAVTELTEKNKSLELSVVAAQSELQQAKKDYETDLAKLRQTIASLEYDLSSAKKNRKETKTQSTSDLQQLQIHKGHIELLRKQNLCLETTAEENKERLQELGVHCAKLENMLRAKQETISQLQQKNMALEGNNEENAEAIEQLSDQLQQARAQSEDSQRQLEVILQENTSLHAKLNARKAELQKLIQSTQNSHGPLENGASFAIYQDSAHETTHDAQNSKATIQTPGLFSSRDPNAGHSKTTHRTKTQANPHSSASTQRINSRTDNAPKQQNPFSTFSRRAFALMR
jgi:chromosome segregation ATPase